jgi:hypothetical protein
MPSLLRPFGGTLDLRIVVVLVGMLVAGSPMRASAQQPEPPPPAAPHYPSLHISGFGDVNFSAVNRADGPKNFSLGQFVLHMASELAPRVTFFGEISFTARSDAGTGSPSATGFNAEVERMAIRFEESDRLKISFGRYHTPINYWNTAFHHGQWLQTTISRPEMIRFGGQFLPVHFVGGLVEGSAPAGGLNLNYKVGVGNGRASVISRAGDPGDSNDSVAWLANAFVRPDAVFGLDLGGSFYGDTITLANGGEVDEQIVAGHAVWSREDPELIGEIASVRHHDALSGQVTWSHAYYVQAAYRLPQAGALWKPYFRFEHIGVPDEDTAFQSVPELDQVTLGVRYDITLFAAIKGEYRTWTRGAGSSRDHGGFLQIAFTF